MKELLDVYQQQAASRLSRTPWLAHLQEQAVADFMRMGFPTRHCEDWKYTTTDTFLKETFSTKPASLNEASLFDSKWCVGFEHATPDVLMNNGQLSIAEALKKKLPAGVLVLSLSDAIRLHADKIRPHLNQITEQKHAFQALNTAMLQNGVFIYVPKNVCIEAPIYLANWQDKAHQAVYLRHVVVAEEGSSCTVIDDYQGEEKAVYFTNTLTEIHLAPRANVTHYKLQCESKLAYHTGHLALKQMAGSQFNSHSFSVGGKWVRSDIAIALSEPRAHCFMNGVYAPGEGQHVDHHTVVHHQAPYCTSAQDYKGILSGHSRAVFNGSVIVAKDAQHTDAKQQNKNLLLSKNSEIDTKPQLEIFADDVICTHGATVGQLDEDALFYLATRGIERPDAMRYLVQAFAIENLRSVTHEGLKDWVATLLNQQVG